MEFRLKRIYDAPEKDDGFRILVDRIWPRGLTREGAAIDLWLKEIAPGAELRKWFGHDPAKWSDFKSRYHLEIRANAGALKILLEKARKGPVTLLYSARDTEHNQARALLEYLEGISD